VTEQAAADTLLLPLYADMSNDDQDRVVGALLRALAERRLTPPFAGDQPDETIGQAAHPASHPTRQGVKPL
jgi:hypothetical protein